MSKHRTQKASSAEAILKHCLRQRGWSKQWRAGTLTGKQHLGLLEDIRQYGRAWMRHEAEAFFDHYGEEVERGIVDRAKGALGRFFDRAKQFVRELVVAGALGLKGSDELSAQELAELDRQAKIQAEYLDNFRREVILNPPVQIAEPNVTVIVSPPPMTPGQFTARAEQYGDSAWRASQQTNRVNAAASGVVSLERRVLGIADHCDDCPPLAELGWQPIGTLPAIGETECRAMCHCHFEFKMPSGKAVKTIKKPTSALKQAPTQPAIPSLPSTGGPKERKPIPPRIKPQLEPPLPTFEQLKKEAEAAGHTFSGVDYEEI